MVNPYRLFLLFCVFASIFSVSAQKKTTTSYGFLNNPVAAKAAALGGTLVSTRETNVALVEDNPAVLNELFHNTLAFSYINYVSDINYMNVGYAKSVKNDGNIAASLQYLSYGKFVRTNEFGDQIGDFSANEYSLNVSYARNINDLVDLGATFKNVFSQLDGYNSYAIATDLGAYYKAKNELFSAGLVINNIGVPVVRYNKTITEKLPFQVNLGISQKFGHAPIRLNFLFQNLHSWNLGKTTAGKFNYDGLLEHLVPSVELIPTENFYVALGYNYKRRQELKIDERTGTTGFSFGLGLKVSKFNISFARAAYHLGGTSNTLTLVTRFSDFKKVNTSSNEKN